MFTERGGDGHGLFVSELSSLRDRYHGWWSDERDCGDDGGRMHVRTLAP